MTREEQEALLEKLVKGWPGFFGDELDTRYIKTLSDDQLKESILDMQELHEK